MGNLAHPVADEGRPADGEGGLSERDIEQVLAVLVAEGLLVYAVREDGALGVASAHPGVDLEELLASVLPHML